MTIATTGTASALRRSRADRDLRRGGRRRGDDGRRHRSGCLSRGLRDAPARPDSRSARARPRADPRGDRALGRAWPPPARGRRRRARPPARRRGSRGACFVRARDRGDSGGSRAQAGAVRAAFGCLWAPDRARDQHLFPSGDGAGERRRPPGERRRNALLQSAARDGAARGDRRRPVVQVRARDRSPDRRAIRQARDRRPRRAGFPRQPLCAAVRDGSAQAPDRADRGTRRDRPDRADGRRLPDGAVRARRPGRHRRRLRGLEVVLGAELPRAALAAEHGPGAHGAGGPLRAQGRPRVLRLLAATPIARAIPNRRPRAERDGSRSRETGGSPTTFARPPRKPATTFASSTSSRRARARSSSTPQSGDPRSIPSPSPRTRTRSC